MGRIVVCLRELDNADSVHEAAIASNKSIGCLLYQHSTC